MPFHRAACRLPPPTQDRSRCKTKLVPGIGQKADGRGQNKALEGCLKSLDGCHVYLLIVAAQYGTLVGKLSITHAEYRRSKEKKLPVSRSSRATAK
jgi:hypothetical protein